MHTIPVLPPLLCLAGLIALASLPGLQAAKPDPSRNQPIEGLRGVLALGVFIQHAAMLPAYLRDGTWPDPPRVFLVGGQASVSLFFIITGYLFWRKILAEGMELNWTALYVRRVFRIGPAYFFAVALLLIGVAWQTGFRPHVPPLHLLLQAGHWLALGLNGGGPDVNGLRDTEGLLFGVQWTLGAEWRFYAALPLLSVITLLGPFELPVLLGAAASLAIAAAAGHGATLVLQALLFCLGMVVASLKARGALRSLPLNAASGLALAAFAAVLGMMPVAYAPGPAVLLALGFGLVASGATLFGVLTCRAVQRLGAASYSLYLLQGPVTLGLFAIPGLRRAALASPAGYWGSIFLCACALLAAAMLSHAAIERPGNAAGRWLARRLPPVRLRLAAPGQATPRPLSTRPWLGGA